MKTANLKITGFFSAIAVLLASAVNTPAKSFDYASLKKTVSAVAIPELPARAAQLVKEASGQDREATAVAVTRVVIERKSTLAAPVVGAIAAAQPEIAASVAAAAAAQEPRQVGVITKAAVSAAPSQAGKIVNAICRKLPAKYGVAALAASQAAPDASKEILDGIASAVPVLKTLIASSTLENFAGSSTLSVSDVIARTQGLVEKAAQMEKVSSGTLLENSVQGEFAKADVKASEFRLTPNGPQGPQPVPTVSTPFTPLGITPPELNRSNTIVVAPGGTRIGPQGPQPPPTVGPPFTPLSGTPNEISRTNTSEVPPGGTRDYSNPTPP